MGSLLPFGSAPSPDATTTRKGKIKLAGDLGGTADLPTVTGLSGKVVGPASATDNAVAIYDGTTGKLIKDSRVIYSTSGTGFQLNATGNEAKIRQAADSFGASSLSLQNRFGAAGAVFYNEGLDLFDFAFVPNSLATGNIRWEHRAVGGKLAANTEGEFEFIEPVATTIWLRSGVGETRIISGIFTITGTTTSLGSTTTGITSTTTNISGTTLNISDTTTNISSTNVNVARAAAGGGAILRIANTQAAGAVQYAQLIVEADNSVANRAFLNQLSSSWVTSGINFASGTALEANAAGGLSVAATQAAGVIRFYAGGTTERARFDASGRLGIGQTTVTAFLHIKAGTTAASTAPIKLTTGTNMTAAEAGAIEFTTDDLFFTITTGTARKAFILDDGTRLTSGRVPFATTNGRLTDDADMTFATDTLSVTKAAVKAGASAGNIARVGGSLPMDNFADVSVGGAETDIYTYTTPADTFATNGDKVIATYGGNFVTVGTELTQLKVYFAGTAIWDSTGVAPTTGTTSWNVETRLIRVSSTVVRYDVTLSTTGASGFVYCTVGELTGLTLSGTNILKITGTSTGVGSGAGDIIGKMSFGVFRPAS